MNRKKGFSLVELLAVVIILAVLALILIPFIGNLIKEAKIKSAVVSAYGYVEAANNEIVSKSTKGEFVEETQYDIKDFNIEGGSLVVKYEGRGPEKGYFNISRSKVSDGVFCINGYEINYQDGKATYVKDGEVCAAPPRPLVCKIKDGKLDYTENTEFEVETVEDLICLSDLVGNGYTFEGKTITLTKDIDFNDNKSYLDKNILATNDINGNGIVEDIKTEVTTGSGFLPIGNNSKLFSGKFTSSSFNTISNLYINRSSRDYTGFFGFLPGGSSVGGFNLVGARITGKDFTGGVVGYNNGTIYSMNLNNITVSGVSNIGGVTGYLTSSGGTIKEITVRGTITGTNSNVGGVVGSKNNGTIISVLVSDTSVSAGRYAGGFMGHDAGGGSVSGVVEGGSVAGTGTGTNSDGGIGMAGKRTGYSYNTSQGTVYTSNTTTLTKNYGWYCPRSCYYPHDGINFSSENANLEFYSNQKYTYNNVEYHVLDSSHVGDVNNSGWWFSYDANGNIKVVRVGSTPATPSQPVCTENCSNPDTYPVEGNSVTGNSCPDGVTDTTPPTCTFNYFVAVTNGIRASFSCTDDTSVPTVASMFNSTTKATYTFAEITDQSRGGTVKTGTVSGNTRNITSTWTTQTVPSNPPTRGLCYYYQMAAIDSCGNEGDYTTSYCYYGFSNPQ